MEYFLRFCKRSLLRESLDDLLIDKIPGRQTDRKTLLGELNWIFTAVTDTIAWNVLPHGIFQIHSTNGILFFFFLVEANVLFWCRSISKVVQTRFVSCQSVQKFFACWADYAICKLFAYFTSNVAFNPSASYVVEFQKSLIVRSVNVYWFTDPFVDILLLSGMHGTWLLRFVFLNFQHW